MKFLIAGNWKMNLSLRESQELVINVNDELRGVELGDVEVLVCPSMINIIPVATVISLNAYPMSIGAQNMHYAESGAFTGECSPQQLTSVGLDYVILGHSERRAIFAETDEFINKKVHAAINAELTPIICIGETLEQRQAGETIAILKSQIDGALEEMTNENVAKCVFAYEPVWAIGTGVSATPEDAASTHDEIRAYLSEKIGVEYAENIYLLYGGSMNDKNAAELLKQKNINGGLIGGAALKPQPFASIIKDAVKICANEK